MDNFNQKLKSLLLVLLSAAIVFAAVSCASPNAPLDDGTDLPGINTTENEDANGEDPADNGSGSNDAPDEGGESDVTPPAEDGKPGEPDGDGTCDIPPDEGEQPDDGDGTNDVPPDEGEQQGEPDGDGTNDAPPVEEEQPEVGDDTETENDTPSDPEISEPDPVWREFGYSYSKGDFAFSGFKASSDSMCLEYANEILSGTLYVSESLAGYPYGDLTQLDWNVSFTSSPNTFQLYMQGLTPLETLCRAYRVTSDIRYLEFGRELILRWIAYSEDSDLSKGNSLLWHDHGTAIRAESLLYFMLVSEGTEIDTAELREMIYNQLVVHARFLADDVHYTENHNHGIIQDVALLHTAYFMDHPDTQSWIDVATDRLQGQLEFAFNSEMVHVENSPGYNAAVIDLFYQIGGFLETMQNEEGRTLMTRVYEAAEFLAWVTMPNGIVAQLGDTASSQELSMYTLKYEKFRNERLNFATSLGNLDEMTAEQKSQVTKYYPDAGYYFYRENWDAESCMDATWKLFKAGYSSRTHKHSDDTSFMMYSKGYEIFTDAGWYNYMSGTPFRTYVISSSAHNVVTVDEKSYSPTAENSNKTGMLFCTEEANLDCALAYNDMYLGVSIDRWFYSSGDLTILYDTVLSEDSHTYSQLFHLAEHISIISQSDSETLLAIAETGYIVRIRQLTSAQLEVCSGKTDGQPLYGYISRGLNLLDETLTLRYVQTSDNADYITVITVEDEYGQVQLKNGTKIHYSDITYDPWGKTLAFADQSITLTQRTRPNLNFEVTVGEDGLVNVNAATDDRMLYAWYVLDAASAKVLYKTGMSGDSEFSYDVSGMTGDLLIKAYAQTTEYSQRVNKMIAALVYDPATGQYHVDEQEKYPHLNLEYFGHHVEQVGDTVYRFCLDYNYSWVSTQRWYIYRNGAYYTVIVTKNQHILEYEFTEPGEYTVMYYLKTANGDNEFWDIDIISVP